MVVEAKGYGPISFEIRSYFIRDTVLFHPKYGPILSEVQSFFSLNTIVE